MYCPPIVTKVVGQEIVIGKASFLKADMPIISEFMLGKQGYVTLPSGGTIEAGGNTGIVLLSDAKGNDQMITKEKLFEAYSEVDNLIDL